MDVNNVKMYWFIFLEENNIDFFWDIFYDSNYDTNKWNVRKKIEIPKIKIVAPILHWIKSFWAPRSGAKYDPIYRKKGYNFLLGGATHCYFEPIFGDGYSYPQIYIYRVSKKGELY